MSPYLYILFFIFGSSSGVSAKQILEYSGRAYSKGVHFYTENHKLTYGKNGKLLDAITAYLDSNETLIAEIRSDFRESLAAPSYIFEDFRTGEVHGVRRENNQIILFSREKGKSEKTKAFAPSNQNDPLTVGGQGLNYYILQNLEKLRDAKSIPVRFLIPGRLEAYDFKMTRVGEKNGKFADFELEIDNWFLKLFAPKLRIQYDTALKRISFYEGISAIKDASEKTVTITINYLN